MGVNMNKITENYLNKINEGDLWTGIKINVGGVYKSFYNQCTMKKCKMFANKECRISCDLYASKQTLNYLNGKLRECKDEKCKQSIQSWIGKMQNKVKTVSTYAKTKM
jgi:hypothetical protein